MVSWTAYSFLFSQKNMKLFFILFWNLFFFLFFLPQSFFLRFFRRSLFVFSLSLSSSISLSLHRFKPFSHFLSIYLHIFLSLSLDLYFSLLHVFLSLTLLYGYSSFPPCSPHILHKGGSGAWWEGNGHCVRWWLGMAAAPVSPEHSLLPRRWLHLQNLLRCWQRKIGWGWTERLFSSPPFIPNPTNMPCCDACSENAQRQSLNK